MAAGDISALVHTGSRITFTVAGITAAGVVDAAKLAAAFLTKTCPKPGGGTQAVKVGLKSITATYDTAAHCTAETFIHDDNRTYTSKARVGDTLTLTMGAGTFSGTGGSSAAQAAAAVTNSSSLTYAKPNLNWLTMRRCRYAGTITLRVQTYCKDGIDTLKFYESGTSAGGTANLIATVTTPTLVGVPANIRARAGLVPHLYCPAFVFIWQAVIDISNLTTYPDGAHYFDAMTTGRIGGSTSPRDTRPLVGNDTIGCGQLKVFLNSGGTLVQSTKTMATTGDDTLGLGTDLLPYATAQKCYDNLATKSGGLIKVKVGTYGADALNFNTIVTDEAVTVQGQGAVPADTYWNPDTVQYYGFSFGSSGMVVLENLKIRVPLSADLEVDVHALIRANGGGTGTMGIRNCEFVGDDPTISGGIMFDQDFGGRILCENVIATGTSGFLVGVESMLFCLGYSIGTDAISNSACGKGVFVRAITKVGTNHMDFLQAVAGSGPRDANIMFEDISNIDQPSAGDVPGPADPYTGVLNIGAGFTDYTVRNLLAHITDPTADSNSSIEFNGSYNLENATFYNDGLAFYPDGSVHDCIVRNVVCRQMQWNNNAPATADFDNLELMAHLNFQSINDIASRCQELTANPFINGAAYDFRPGTGLLNRSPGYGYGDISGEVIPTDGTAAIGALTGDVSPLPPPTPPTTPTDRAVRAIRSVRVQRASMD